MSRRHASTRTGTHHPPPSITASDTPRPARPQALLTLERAHSEHSRRRLVLRTRSLSAPLPPRVARPRSGRRACCQRTAAGSSATQTEARRLPCVEMPVNTADRRPLTTPLRLKRSRRRGDCFTRKDKRGAAAARGSHAYADRKTGGWHPGFRAQRSARAAETAECRAASYAGLSASRTCCLVDGRKRRSEVRRIDRSAAVVGVAHVSAWR